MKTTDPFVALARRQEPLSVAEVAEIMGISVKLVREMIRQNELLAEKKSGRYEVEPQQLLSYLRRKSQPQLIVVK